MELTNFGSIMKFAIERETEVRAILEEAAKSEKLSSLLERIGEMAALNQSNLKILERTRREGICEMVLHPITGLNADNYLFSVPQVSQMSQNDFEAMIKDVSGKISKFYVEAADKLPADDAKRAFQKLAKIKYTVKREA